MLKTMNKKITLVLLLMLTVVSSLVLFVSPIYAATTGTITGISHESTNTYKITHTGLRPEGSINDYHLSSLENVYIVKNDEILISRVYGVGRDGDIYELTIDEKMSSNITLSSISVTPNAIYFEGPNMATTDDYISYNIIEMNNREQEYDIYFELKASDGLDPVISGETTFVTNIDEQRPLSYFTDWLRAYDETDGDITSKIKVDVDNYTANKSVLGTHTVTVSVADTSGNKTTAVINIYVADVTKPVISGSTAVAQIGYKETYNITNFKASLTVADNYDTLTHSSITVKADGYTANKAKLGTYNITFAVKDSSGNEGTFTKQVKVIDNVKPVFDGPLTIATSNTTIMTESDVRARLTASDEIDGNLTTKITLVEDNYSGKGNKVGSYTIKYSVTDNAGNIAEHTVTINRTDTMPPKIYVENGKTIRIPQGTTITREQVLDILESTGVLKVNAMTTFSFPVDEYTGNEETPGAYLMSIKARSTNGNEDLFNVTLQVLSETETPNTDDDIVKDADFDLGVWIGKHKLETALIIVGALIVIVGGVVLLVSSSGSKKHGRRY